MISAATTTVALALAGTCIAAPAGAAISSSPNARTLTLQCPQGTITGTTAGGSNLILDGGGVAVLQGATSAAGEVLVPLNPGLDRIGKLVRCTYDSPRSGAATVAFVLFP